MIRAIAFDDSNPVVITSQIEKAVAIGNRDTR